MSTLTVAVTGWDRDQVRPFLAEFAGLREAMQERGEYHYNDSFLGKIEGIAGPTEGRAIYLLQGLYRIEQEHRDIAALRADGFRDLDELDSGEARFASIVLWHEDYYSGGTGKIVRYEEARLVPRDGRPYAVLPKGKRARGYLVESAQVLVR